MCGVSGECLNIPMEPGFDFDDRIIATQQDSCSRLPLNSSLTSTTRATRSIKAARWRHCKCSKTRSLSACRADRQCWCGERPTATLGSDDSISLRKTCVLRHRRCAVGRNPGPVWLSRGTEAKCGMAERRLRDQSRCSWPQSSSSLTVVADQSEHLRQPSDELRHLLRAASPDMDTEDRAVYIPGTRRRPGAGGVLNVWPTAEKRGDEFGNLGAGWVGLVVSTVSFADLVECLSQMLCIAWSGAFPDQEVVAHERILPDPSDNRAPCQSTPVTGDLPFHRHARS